MEFGQQVKQFAIFVVVTVATLAVAETRKEYKFTVGPNPRVSIINQYGSVSIHPSAGNLVVVNATLYSDKVEVDQSQSGNRVNVQTHMLPGSSPDNARVDYDVMVPSDASVRLESANGVLHAERLRGDVEAEGAGATVEVRDISDSHVHVKTIRGPITLSNIRNGHVEVDSVSGRVSLVSVSGPLVRVSSTSGKITYDGDFGYGGEYRFNSDSGDIDATIPEHTSADVEARSVVGKVQSDVLLQPKTHPSFLMKEGGSFAGTINKAASSVWLRTFSGKIHLKKR
jgi:DUF4097 and DUF4098 domain-containing protein YvlB